VRSLTLTFAAALALAPSLVLGEPAPRLLAGPDILVSRDGAVPHYEVVVAVHPRDARNLVGASITRTSRKAGSAVKVYVSADGGGTWTDIELREQAELGGGDPLVGFTGDGTALVAALGSAFDASGRRRDAVLVYRSEDGGRTWQTPFAAGMGEGHDHPQIAIDTTGGRFSGNVYISTLYADEENPFLIGLLRSTDGGRTFSRSLIANGGAEVMLFNGSMVVLSDGTLIVGLEAAANTPENRGRIGRSAQRVTFMTSTDGGLTFSPQRPIGTREIDQAYAIEATQVQLAVGRVRLRDRLYAAWTDFRFGAPRILFTWSADRGETWSEPRRIDATVPDTARQLQPALAVGDGAVGISWFDTRHAADGNAYDQYFAASLDGGATFLPPVRVSSESSPLPGAGNLAPNPLVLPAKEGFRVALSTVATRWPFGGDYMGLAPAPGGIFHLLWADNRSGTFQLHTSRIVVVSGDVAPAEPPGLEERAITDRVELVFDPGSYDSSARAGTVAVRLRNISDAPIYGPVRLEIGTFPPPPEGAVRQVPLEVLDAPNGKTGPGAAFDYTPLLGPQRHLAPGEVGGALTLRLRYALTDPRPDFTLLVYGCVLPAAH
jgi:BNR repeat-like domain